MNWEPLTPMQVEQKLRQLVTDLTLAEKSLREARDREVDTELSYRAAHRKAILSEDCPRVSRSGVTAADRDAWVDERCADEWQAYRLAQAAREAAQDHVRTVRDVAVTVQSIGALVRTAYSMAGTS